MLNINNLYLLSPYVLDDGNVFKIRAIETETIQTNTIYFHMHPINNPDVYISLIGFTNQEKDDLRVLIKNVLNAEVNKTNKDLAIYGIALFTDFEVLFPYETSEVKGVPSITDYTSMYIAESINYLNELEVLYTESLTRKNYINSAVDGVKGSSSWQKLDLIVPLGHSNLVLPELSNKNLLLPLPDDLLSLHTGSAGAKITDVGLRLSNVVGDSGYIKLGYQPSDPRFNKYFPTPNFTKNSCSFSVCISEAIGSGIIFHRGDHQDLLIWNSGLSRFEFNIHGDPNEGGLAVYPYSGSLDGVWTVSRPNSTSIELWKNNVKLGTFNTLSYDTIVDYNYSSLGWSGMDRNALNTIYKFATIGAYLNQEDMDSLAGGITYYTDNLPANA